MANLFKSIGNFFKGTPEKRENVSTLRPEQEGLYNQLIGSARGAGAGGAFGQSADYYRGLLSDNSEDYDAFANPAIRQYNQDIVPGISEQFAGMGSGGLSSSAFKNAQAQGSTDLAERLGAIRANLRQQAAQGLQNIGQQGLQNYSQNMTTQPGSSGLFSQLAPAIGTAAGAAIGGPAGAAVGGSLGGLAGNWFSGMPSSNNSNSGNSVGANSIPNWKGPASPQQMNSGSGQDFKLPGYLSGTRYGA